MKLLANPKLLQDALSFGGLGLAAGGIWALFGWAWALVLVGVTLFYISGAWR